MPSRRISANPNLAPVQEIAVNPYSSFNSDNVNMLTRIVTGGKNKDFVVAGLDVTGKNTVSETLGTNILTEHFTSSISGWTGSNVAWDSGSGGRAKASIPSPLTAINATLTYNTLISSSYVGQYIKVQFTLTDSPKSLFVTVGNQTKSYDHPAAGSYTCNLQLSDKGPAPLSLVFTIQLDSTDLNSNSIVYLDEVILDQVINLGTDINPITLPTVSTPDLYAGTNLDATNIPLNMLHPHITSHVLPGVCIKDETTLCFTGTNATQPILALDYSNAANWISGVPFSVSDFYSPTVTHYSVNGGSAVSTTFDGTGKLLVTLVDDGGGASVTKIVGNTTGTNSAFVKWAYLVVYYSYFKNPVPNNAYIGLAKESEITDARFGEDYLILAKLRFVDAVTVDAIIYYPDRKDLAYNDATRITYNNITQLEYWDTKPLNVSQALDELAYKIANMSGGGGGSAGGGTGEFNVRWGKDITILVYPDVNPAHGWDMSNTGTNAPYVTPSTQSISDWSTAYTNNSASWVWSSISWNNVTLKWEVSAGGGGEPFSNLDMAIAQWSSSKKAYVVLNSTTPSEFRIVNPINPPGDNFVRGPLTSEVTTGTNKLFLAADGTWQVPTVTIPPSTDHNLLVFENYSEFKLWYNAQNTTYTWEPGQLTKTGLKLTSDYAKMIYVTTDNTWWKTPQNPAEISGGSVTWGTWTSGTATINDVPNVIKRITNEFEVRWGASNSDWPGSIPSSWQWRTITVTNGTLVANTTASPVTTWSGAANIFPTKAYAVYNTNDPTSFRIVNPFNPMGNGLVRGPTTSEVQETLEPLFLSADGSWKSVPLQDAAANGDFYKDNLNGSTSSNIILTPVSDTLGDVNDTPITFIDGMKMRFIASMSNTVIYNNFIVSSVSGVGYNGPTTNSIFIQQSTILYTSSDNIWTITSTNSGSNTIWTLVDVTTSTIHFILTISGNNQPLPPTSVFVSSTGGIGTFTIIPTVSAISITTINVWNPDKSMVIGSAKTLVKNGVGSSSIPVIAGDIQAGQVYELTYDSNTDTIVVAEGLLKTKGINVLYADFNNNTGILNLSPYNINPEDQSIYQVIPTKPIASLIENHITVSSAMINPSPLPPAYGISSPAQLFQGNGAGADMWRQWNMNDSSGTTITNTGINPSTDTVWKWTGSSLVSGDVSTMQNKRTYGPPQKAFIFNENVQRFIDVGTVLTNTDPLIPSSLTISFWMNAKNNGGSYDIYCRSANNGNDYFKIRMASSGNLVLIIGNGTGTSYTLAPASSFTSYPWNHIALTCTTNEPTSANLIIGYVNGVQTSSQTTTISFTNGYGTGFHTSIARHGAYSANYFNGKLSEFRLYKTVLSALQINSIYRYGNGSPTVTNIVNNDVSHNVPTTNLVRYFKFDDNASNQTVTDYGPNSINATLWKTNYTTSLYSSGVAGLLWMLNGGLSFNNTTIQLGTLSQYTFDLNKTSTFTYTFWILDRGANTGSSQAIISKGYGDATNLWMIYFDYGTGALYAATDGSYTKLVDSSLIPGGTHIAITCNYRTISVYINGKYYNTNTTGNICNYPGQVDTAGNQQPYIGSLSGGRYFYNGGLDDFRIYSKVLPATDIANIYNNVEIPYSSLTSPGTTPTNSTDYYSSTATPTTISAGSTCTVIFPSSTLVDNIIFRNKYTAFGNRPTPNGYASDEWTVSSYTLSGDSNYHQQLNLAGTTRQNIGSLSFDGTPVQKLVFQFSNTPIHTGILDNISILSFNRSNNLLIGLDNVTTKPLLASDGTDEYLDQIGTNQIINIQYNAGTDSFIILNPKPDLVVNTTTLVRGWYTEITHSKLSCIMGTGSIVADYTNFSSNYDFFNMLNNRLLTSYSNSAVTGTTPPLQNYWWRLLPYNIPYESKKIIIEAHYCETNDGTNENFNLIITLDFINRLVTMDVDSTYSNSTYLFQYLTDMSDGYNSIVNTPSDSNNSFYVGNIEFDNNFIYSLPVANVYSNWNVKYKITSYR